MSTKPFFRAQDEMIATPAGLMTYEESTSLLAIYDDEHAAARKAEDWTKHAVALNLGAELIVARIQVRAYRRLKGIRPCVG